MSTDLVPVPVPGTDRQIMATLVDGTPMVSVRHACEAIGLDFANQHRKLKGRSWAGVAMIATPSAGGIQQTAMVDRRTFTMWLATIDARRVNADPRPINEAFQAEAADALDAYFNEGGAINPRASEDQLERIARHARAQAEVLNALKGLIDPQHLEAKARVVLARALGEAPELDPATQPLYVWDYLREKGLPQALIEAKAPGFGTRVKGQFIVTHDREPRKHHQQLPNGTVRRVNAYTEADRPLFDSVWARHYANTVSEAALFVLPGGVS